MDLSYLVGQIKGTDNSPTLRLRQAYVVASHNSPKRVDIQIAEIRILYPQSNIYTVMHHK